MDDQRAYRAIEAGAEQGLNAIQAVREYLGLSREELAEKAGFDLACLKACEEHHGVATPAPCFKESLAQALGVPVEMLFGFNPRRTH